MILSSPLTAIESLTWTISHRVHSSSRPATLLSTLALVIASHRNAVQKHNELVEQLRMVVSPQEKFARYFGLALAGGVGVDTNYPDVMLAIQKYADDCIYFSLLLADILNETGRNLAFRIGRSAPPVSEADFSAVEDSLPDVKFYSDYEAQFRPKKVEMIVTM